MASEKKKPMNEEKIKSFFRKLGLETETDRQRFIRFRRLADARAASKARNVQKITTDNTRSENQDAKLERDAK